MNRLYGIILLGLLFATAAAAQHTTILLRDQQNDLPVEQAVCQVFFPGGQEEILLSDQDGRVVVSGIAGPDSLRVAITHLSYLSRQVSVAPGEEHLVSLQPAGRVLGEVVITGQYAPTHPEKAVHAVKVISAGEINRMAAVSLRDVLTNQLNIRLQQDNALGTGISMLGMSGENVKILIDGVPVIGRLNGNIDLAQVLLTSVERIEIIEGPLSVQYGTNALAGTINIITRKKLQHQTQIQANGYWENIGTYNLSGSFAQRYGRHAYTLSGGRHYFDGWSADDPFLPDLSRPVADSTRVKSWKPREQYFGRLQYFYTMDKYRLGYRGEFFNETLINKGAPRRPYNESAFDAYFRTTRIDQSVTLDGSISPYLRLAAVASYNHYARERTTYVKNLTDLSGELSTNPGDQDLSTFGQWMSRGSLTSTNETARLNFEIGYDINHETSTGGRISENAGDITDAAAFASAEWLISGSFKLRPALRVAYNSVYDAPLIPSLHTFWRHHDWIFRASYARGFRAPTLKELYLEFVDINHNIIGNPALRAEHSHNFSMSAKRDFRLAGIAASAEVTGFYNRIRDQITLAQSVTVAGEYTYYNLGRFESTGGRLLLSLQQGSWGGQIGATLTGIRNQIDEAGTLPDLAYANELSGRITYDFSTPGTQLSVFYKYQGRQPLLLISEDGQASQSFIGAYHWMDVTFRFPLADERLYLSLGAKNLFNVRNVAASLQGSVHSDASASTPVGTGLILFAKAELNLSR